MCIGIFQIHVTIVITLLAHGWGGVSNGRLLKELYLSNFGDHRPSRSEDNSNFTL